MSTDIEDLSQTLSDALSENFSTKDATGRLNVADGLFAIALAITSLSEEVAALNDTLEKRK